MNEEDGGDIRDAEEAMAAIEAGEPTIPLEELKAELGFRPDCSDIPEITDETRLVMARDRRDAEGRLIRARRSTST